MRTLRRIIALALLLAAAVAATTPRTHGGLTPHELRDAVLRVHVDWILYPHGSFGPWGDLNDWGPLPRRNPVQHDWMPSLWVPAKARDRIALCEALTRDDDADVRAGAVMCLVLASLSDPSFLAPTIAGRAVGWMETDPSDDVRSTAALLVLNTSAEWPDDLGERVEARIRCALTNGTFRRRYCFAVAFLKVAFPPRSDVAIRAVGELMLGDVWSGRDLCELLSRRTDATSRAVLERVMRESRRAVVRLTAARALAGQDKLSDEALWSVVEADASADPVTAIGALRAAEQPPPPRVVDALVSMALALPPDNPGTPAGRRSFPVFARVLCLSDRNEVRSRVVAALLAHEDLDEVRRGVLQAEID